MWQNVNIITPECRLHRQFSCSQESRQITCCDSGQHACAKIGQPIYNDVNCEDNLSVCLGWMSKPSTTDLPVDFKSSGTANWDPQPAVDKFLTVKDRKQTAPDIKTYKNVNLCGNFSSKWIGLHTTEVQKYCIHYSNFWQSDWLHIVVLIACVLCTL